MAAIAERLLLGFLTSTYTNYSNERAISIVIAIQPFGRKASLVLTKPAFS
jgi:hypothetical protein